VSGFGYFQTFCCTGYFLLLLYRTIDLYVQKISKKWAKHRFASSSCKTRVFSSSLLRSVQICADLPKKRQICADLPKMDVIICPQFVPYSRTLTENTADLLHLLKTQQICADLPKTRHICSDLPQSAQILDWFGLIWG
jgi:hypothetical protein